MLLRKCNVFQHVPHTLKMVRKKSTFLTHWGRVTHICVGTNNNIGSNNGLSPDRRQAIIWTNAGLLSIGPLRTYLSENLIKMQQFSLKKMLLKMSSGKWRPSCLGLNVLSLWSYVSIFSTVTWWVPNSRIWIFRILSLSMGWFLSSLKYFVSGPSKVLNALDVCSAPKIWETMDVLMIILWDSKIKINDLCVCYFTNNA